MFVLKMSLIRIDTRTHGENSEETSVSSASPDDLCGGPEVISTDCVEGATDKKTRKTCKKEKAKFKRNAGEQHVHVLENSWLRKYLEILTATVH